jgi:hypothetical protein
MFFFRAVVYLFMQCRFDIYIAYRGMAGSQLKKIPAYATLLLTMKPEVESPLNRIYISHNRRDHSAFAVFWWCLLVCFHL